MPAACENNFSDMLDGEEISWLSPGWGGDEDGQLVNQGPGSFYLKSKVNNHFYLKPNLTQFYLKLKVSKSARLVAAGCLVFLVYLLYSYHNLPQEGGEGSGHLVNHQEEEEEENSGVPVSPAKQVLSFIKNIWFILTLCHRWGWTFTTRCFARTAATLSSMSSGRPFKSICSVNISNSHQESFETLGSDCLMFFQAGGCTWC